MCIRDRYVSKLSTTVGSFEELNAIVGTDTLNQFAQMSGFSLEELETQIQSNIEARRRATAIQEEQLIAMQEMTKRLQFARDAIGAFAQIETNLQSFDAALANSGQSISNAFGPAVMGQISSAFKDLTNIVDKDVFDQQVDAVASVFGSAGETLGTELKQVADIASALPSALIQSSDEIGIGGARASDIILKKLKDAGINISDAMERQIAGRISAIADTGEGGVGKFKGKIKADLDGTVKELMKGMLESQKAFQAAARLSLIHI